jgi:hypothetical protein
LNELHVRARLLCRDRSQFIACDHAST